MDDDTDDGESAESEVVSTAGAGEGDSNITTQEAFDRNLANESGDERSDRYFYRDLPEANVENIVIDFTDCHKRLDTMFNGWNQTAPEEVATFLREAGSFVNGSTKTVNQMAQQFEMKKRAEVDRQTKVSSTGELDMEALVNYKFTEDIFLRAEDTPNGKNHGLVILVDWSGSMCECMGETIEQMVQLVLFCKKVQIPFEVYGFTNNDFSRATYSYDREDESKKWNDDSEIFGDNFQMLNLMSSRMNTLQYKAGLKHMMMLAAVHGRGGYSLNCQVDYAFGLSGTPLDEALATLNTIIPAFRAANDLNIVNLTIITDGCSNGNHWGRMNNEYGTPILRNKRNGATYAAKNCYDSMTGNLLNYLRDETGVNIVGIFLEPSSPKRAVYSLVNRYDDLNKIGYDACLDQFKKEGFVSTTEDGYDEYFIIAAKKKVSQVDIADLDEDASLTKIKNTFVKSSAGSKSSRLMLNRMIDHLA